ncbi:hypothetical protein E2C01_068126 [Portunus trituberculatus]|uniref:Uncharacterized protein n=1 Tax=Portunus trituberculatus TaxID=210409 RepID=A0A5B7HVR8_PORTR|nr:hypothetical protein [Portunus trituberculatus]
MKSKRQAPQRLSGDPRTLVMFRSYRPALPQSPTPPSGHTHQQNSLLRLRIQMLPVVTRIPCRRAPHLGTSPGRLSLQT